MYDNVILLNDSVYALRPSTEMVRAIYTGNYSIVGINYSHTGHHFWLESVYRAFSTTHGLPTFIQHSCTAQAQRACRQRFRHKRCIVERFEISLAQQYDRLQMRGLYPSDPPPHLVAAGAPNRTWLNRNPQMWTWLVSQRGFFLKKIKDTAVPVMVGPSDPYLANCTRHLDWEWVQSWFHANGTIKWSGNAFGNATR